jgi:hypothetical protein
VPAPSIDDMNDRPRPDQRAPGDPSAMDAEFAVRRARRDAAAGARRLGDRLTEVDIHQREARFVLERAGMLARRRAARNGDGPSET